MFLSPCRIVAVRHRYPAGQSSATPATATSIPTYARSTPSASPTTTSQPSARSPAPAAPTIHPPSAYVAFHRGQWRHPGLRSTASFPHHRQRGGTAGATVANHAQGCCLLSSAARTTGGPGHRSHAVAWSGQSWKLVGLGRLRVAAFNSQPGLGPGVVIHAHHHVVAVVVGRWRRTTDTADSSRRRRRHRRPAHH